MADVEPLTGATIYEQTDAALGGQQIGDVVTDLAPYTVPRFASSAARDTAYAAHVSAGGSLDTGMVCTVAGALQVYASSGWRTIFTYGAGFPGAVLTGSGLQTLGSATWSNITWQTETYDPANAHSTSSNTQRFVAPQTRMYQVSAAIDFGASASGRRGIRIVHNDDSSSATTTRNVVVGAVTNTRLSISSGFLLTAGEYVAIQMYQDTGSNITVDRSLAHMAVIPAPLF